MSKISDLLTQIEAIVGEPIELVYGADRKDPETGKIIVEYLPYVENTAAARTLTYLQSYKMAFYGIRFKRNLNLYVTTWYMTQFPGCCAFAIATGSTVHYTRRRGINILANQIRQEIARNAGYTALFATDVETNIGSVKTLEKNGYSTLYKVKNKRTDNPVFLAIKEL